MGARGFKGLDEKISKSPKECFDQSVKTRRGRWAGRIGGGARCECDSFASARVGRLDRLVQVPSMGLVT